MIASKELTDLFKTSIGQYIPEVLNDDTFSVEVEQEINVGFIIAIESVVFGKKNKYYFNNNKRSLFMNYDLHFTVQGNALELLIKEWRDAKDIERNEKIKEAILKGATADYIMTILKPSQIR